MWQNEEVEKEVDFLQKTARIIRSARSDYNLPNKVKTQIYITGTDEHSIQILRKYAGHLATIAYCCKVEFVNSPPTTGCAILTISGRCEVHLLLKGLIEADKEIDKLEKKRKQLDSVVNKLQQTMASNDYLIKVPEEVRSANSIKLLQSQDEIERIITAIDTLKLL